MGRLDGNFRLYTSRPDCLMVGLEGDVYPSQLTQNELTYLRRFYMLPMGCKAELHDNGTDFRNITGFTGFVKLYRYKTEYNRRAA